MQWIALSVVVALLILAVIAVMVPVRLRLKLKGRGEVGKTWVLAGGAEMSVLTLSIAMAHGIDGVLQMHLLRWRVLHVTPLGKRVLEDDEQGRMSLSGVRKALDELQERIERRVTVRDALWFALSQRRWVVLEKLQGRFIYSTHDVALTGMILGQLYTLTGILAPWGQVHVEARWIDVASADASFDVVVRLRPVRIALNVVLFAIKNVKRRQREQPDASPASALKQGGHNAR